MVPIAAFMGHFLMTSGEKFANQRKEIIDKIIELNRFGKLVKKYFTFSHLINKLSSISDTFFSNSNSQPAIFIKDFHDYNSKLQAAG